jgi:hypothetical protein
MREQEIEELWTELIANSDAYSAGKINRGEFADRQEDIWNSLVRRVHVWAVEGEGDTVSVE